MIHQPAVSYSNFSTLFCFCVSVSPSHLPRDFPSFSYPASILHLVVVPSFLDTQFHIFHLFLFLHFSFWHLYWYIFKPTDHFLGHVVYWSAYEGHSYFSVAEHSISSMHFIFFLVWISLVMLLICSYVVFTFLLEPLALSITVILNFYCDNLKYVTKSESISDSCFVSPYRIFAC